MSTVAVGIGEIIAGVLLTPFTGGTSLLLTAAGLATYIQGSEQQKQAQQAAAYTGTTGGTAPGSTGTGTGTGATGGGTTPTTPVPGNAPGAPTYTVPNQFEIYQEQARAANIAQAAFETKAGEQILNLKTQEQGVESSIRASAAARGLKLEGSPLYQLASQQQRGGRAIDVAESSFKATDLSQSLGNQASWNQGMLNLAEQNFQIQTTQQNQWLSAFADAIGFGTKLLGQSWNPPMSLSGGGYGSAQTTAWGLMP